MARFFSSSCQGARSLSVSLPIHDRVQFHACMFKLCVGESAFVSCSRVLVVVSCSCSCSSPFSCSTFVLVICGFGCLFTLICCCLLFFVSAVMLTLLPCSCQFPCQDQVRPRGHLCVLDLVLLGAALFFFDPVPLKQVRRCFCG